MFATAGCSKDDVAATAATVVKDDADAFVGTWEGTLTLNVRSLTTGNTTRREEATSFPFTKKNAQIITRPWEGKMVDVIVRGKVAEVPLYGGGAVSNLTLTILTPTSMEVKGTISSGFTGTYTGILYKK